MKFNPPMPFDHLLRIMRAFPEDAVVDTVDTVDPDRLLIKAPDSTTVYGWFAPEGVWIKTPNGGDR
jgi:hypothetical protein